MYSSRCSRILLALLLTTGFFLEAYIALGVCDPTNNLAGDDDNDGLSNAQELAQLLPPCSLNTNLTPGVTERLELISGEDRLAITFRARELPDLSYNYQVQESVNMTNWMDVDMYANRTAISNASDSGGSFDLVTVHTGLAPSNDPNVFMRVQFINPWPTPAVQNAYVNLTGLVAHTRSSALSILPDNTLHKQIYDVYSASTNCQWSRFSWVNRVNLSGLVSDNSSKSCTLVSPRHIVMAAHHVRWVNSKAVFHTRAGERVERTITGVFSTEQISPGAGRDIAVGLLDTAITNIPFYKVLPSRTDWSSHLLGASGIVTRYNYREVLVRKVSNFYHGTNGTRWVKFAADPAIPSYYAGTVTVGDSGNPSFLLVRGEPVFFHMVSLTGTTGPFISDPNNYETINQFMTDLGGGYQLTPIALDP